MRAALRGTNFENAHMIGISACVGGEKEATVGGSACGIGGEFLNHQLIKPSYSVICSRQLKQIYSKMILIHMETVISVNCRMNPNAQSFVMLGVMEGIWKNY